MQEQEIYENYDSIQTFNPQEPGIKINRQLEEITHLSGNKVLGAGDRMGNLLYPLICFLEGRNCDISPTLYDSSFGKVTRRTNVRLDFNITSTNPIAVGFNPRASVDNIVIYDYMTQTILYRQTITSSWPTGYKYRKPTIYKFLLKQQSVFTVTDLIGSVIDGILTNTAFNPLAEMDSLLSVQVPENDRVTMIDGREGVGGVILGIPGDNYKSVLAPNTALTFLKSGNIFMNTPSTMATHIPAWTMFTVTVSTSTTITFNTVTSTGVYPFVSGTYNPGNAYVYTPVVPINQIVALSGGPGLLNLFISDTAMTSEVMWFRISSATQNRTFSIIAHGFDDAIVDENLNQEVKVIHTPNCFSNDLFGMVKRDLKFIFPAKHMTQHAGMISDALHWIWAKFKPLLSDGLIEIGNYLRNKSRNIYNQKAMMKSTNDNEEFNLGKDNDNKDIFDPELNKLILMAQSNTQFKPVSVMRERKFGGNIIQMKIPQGKTVRANLSRYIDSIEIAEKKFRQNAMMKKENPCNTGVNIKEFNLENIQEVQSTTKYLTPQDAGQTYIKYHYLPGKLIVSNYKLEYDPETKEDLIMLNARPSYFTESIPVWDYTFYYTHHTEIQKDFLNMSQHACLTKPKIKNICINDFLNELPIEKIDISQKAMKASGKEVKKSVGPSVSKNKVSLIDKARLIMNEKKETIEKGRPRSKSQFKKKTASNLYPETSLFKETKITKVEDFQSLHPFPEDEIKSLEPSLTKLSRVVGGEVEWDYGISWCMFPVVVTIQEEVQSVWPRTVYLSLEKPNTTLCNFTEYKLKVCTSVKIYIDNRFKDINHVGLVAEASLVQNSAFTHPTFSGTTFYVCLDFKRIEDPFLKKDIITENSSDVAIWMLFSGNTCGCYVSGGIKVSEDLYAELDVMDDEVVYTKITTGIFPLGSGYGNMPLFLFFPNAALSVVDLNRMHFPLGRSTIYNKMTGDDLMDNTIPLQFFQFGTIDDLCAFGMLKPFQRGYIFGKDIFKSIAGAENPYESNENNVIINLFEPNFAVQRKVIDALNLGIFDQDTVETIPKLGITSNKTVWNNVVESYYKVLPTLKLKYSRNIIFEDANHDPLNVWADDVWTNWDVIYSYLPTGTQFAKERYIVPFYTMFKDKKLGGLTYLFKDKTVTGWTKFLNQFYTEYLKGNLEEDNVKLTHDWEDIKEPKPFKMMDKKVLRDLLKEYINKFNNYISGDKYKFTMITAFKQKSVAAKVDKGGERGQSQSKKRVVFSEVEEIPFEAQDDEPYEDIQGDEGEGGFEEQQEEIKSKKSIAPGKSEECFYVIKKGVNRSYFTGKYSENRGVVYDLTRYTGSVPNTIVKVTTALPNGNHVIFDDGQYIEHVKRDDG